MPAAMHPLEAEIRQRISQNGPMPVAQYMALCLTHPAHGYYVTRDPLGAEGDFTTAPEITQMFGELIGLWAAAVWKQMGSPEHLRLVELGPGRGTMMLDVLRAVKRVPEFRRTIKVHFVEVSPRFEKSQRDAFVNSDVPVEWHKALEKVPEGPAIILANEFFDALPVQQAVMCVDGWHERVIKIDDKDQLRFGHAIDPMPLLDDMLPPNVQQAQIGEIFEWRADAIVLELACRVARSPGAALVLDYGHVESATGDTLQAVTGHRFASPLAAPGRVDLTVHVDFQALAQAARGMDARVHGPVEQGVFLRRLGIESRAAMLKKAAPPERAAEIEAAMARLVSEDRTGMGRQFKVIGFAHDDFGVLPGLEP